MNNTKYKKICSHHLDIAKNDVDTVPKKIALKVRYNKSIFTREQLRTFFWMEIYYEQPRAPIVQLIRENNKRLKDVNRFAIEWQVVSEWAHNLKGEEK